MNRLSSILAAAAMTLAASAGAQTLKMTNQVVRINAYEASTSVNLVVVKPEVKLDVLDPSVFTVETNGVERVVKIVYTCDDRGEWTDGGDYLAFGLEVSRERGAAPLVSRGMGSWSTAYPVKVALKSGKKIKAEQEFVYIEKKIYCPKCFQAKRDWDFLAFHALIDD